MRERNGNNCCFFFLYTVVWGLALPFTFFSPRLRQGLASRMGRNLPRGPFDLWIQAASVGECQLAVRLVQEVRSRKELKILVTTCTREGKKILDDDLDREGCVSAYFPFDLPGIMKKAFLGITPRAAVLLETEIWPGFMRECSRRSIPLITANARMSTKSYARYLRLGSRLKKYGPNEVVAVSEQDARRYVDIFPLARATVAPNMKFDALDPEEPIPFVDNPLSDLFGPRPYLFVLASVREQEERYVREIIRSLLSRHPAAVIALFPRHMHRIRTWEDFFKKQGINYSLRSKIQEKAAPGSVILWDGFGELKYAYALARSAYVGGSLVSCGGQNFLEAIEQGVVPCIGPHWFNFAWAGREILSTGLAREVEDPAFMADCLEALPPSNREKVCADFRDYLQKRKGGSGTNAERILAALDAERFCPPD
ncbi:MAG: 3-deoxy-D-manno-octulosonic acid transferase [Desulfonatronovibrionaceae bacterium]